MTFKRAGTGVTLCVGILIGALGALVTQSAESSSWLRAGGNLLSNNVTLAVLVSLLIFFVSWRRDRLALSSNLNKQIQDYNLAIFKDPKLAEQVAEQTFPGQDARWVQGLFAVFYVINMVRDSKLVRERFFVRPDYMFKEDEFIWLTANDYPEQLIYVLDGERGYHPDFKEFIWETLRIRHSEDWIEDVRNRLIAGGMGPSQRLPNSRTRIG